MWEQNQSRVEQCIKFLTRAIDKNQLAIEDTKFIEDFKSLDKVLFQMIMYLHEFNFYPSDIFGKCCEVAFFTSLIGSRWNLEDKEKLTLDQMFKNLVKHCQGSCCKKTKYAVIVTDNWDDDIYDFWKSNIDKLKADGFFIEIHMLIGRNRIVHKL